MRDISRNIGFTFLCCYFCFEQSDGAFRGKLVLERFFTLYFYGSVFIIHRHDEEEINASFKRNAQTPVVLAQVEFCRLCAFLRSDNFCRCIRTGMAGSRDMADYHCGRCAFIPFLL